MVFPVVTYGCESWTITEAKRRIDAFQLWYWRGLLRVPWTARRSNQSILKEINSDYSLEGLMLKLKLKLMSVELVMPSNHLILCHSLMLLPSFFPIIRVFSNESVLCIRWPKYWIFSFSISSSSEYSGLISFRIHWFDLLAVQGTLKSLPQHHSSKVSVQCSAFFMVQLSHPYMTTRKTIALTIWTLSAKWCFCFLIYCLCLL